MATYTVLRGAAYNPNAAFGGAGVLVTVGGFTAAVNYFYGKPYVTVFTLNTDTPVTETGEANGYNGVYAARGGVRPVSYRRALANVLFSAGITAAVTAINATPLPRGAGRKAAKRLALRAAAKAARAALGVKGAAGRRAVNLYLANAARRGYA